MLFSQTVVGLEVEQKIPLQMTENLGTLGVPDMLVDDLLVSDRNQNSIVLFIRV